MTVERRCPTCIGLATLGEEKSMTTVRGCAGAGIPAVSSDKSLQRLRDPVVIQTQVQEPRAGHFGGAGDRGEVDAARDFLGQVARFLAERLGERHAAVGLVIAELGVGRGADRRLRSRRGRLPRARPGRTAHAGVPVDSWWSIERG